MLTKSPSSIDSVKSSDYSSAMRSATATFLHRLIAVVMLLGLISHAASLDHDHFNALETHSHSSDQEQTSDNSDSAGEDHKESYGHHHHNECPSVLSTTVDPSWDEIGFSISDHRCKDGPVFGIEYPPQLS